MIDKHKGDALNHYLGKVAEEDRPALTSMLEKNWKAQEAEKVYMMKARAKSRKAMKDYEQRLIESAPGYKTQCAIQAEKKRLETLGIAESKAETEAYNALPWYKQLQIFCTSTGAKCWIGLWIIVIASVYIEKIING